MTPTYQEAWSNKITESLTFNNEEFPVYYIGKLELKKNKKSAGRPKDLDDLDYCLIRITVRNEIKQ